MATLTAYKLRSNINELDRAIRAGLTSGNIAEVMKEKTRNLFILQPTLPEELQNVYEEPAFLWGFCVEWKKAGKNLDPKFMLEQQKAMQNFEQFTASRLAGSGLGKDGGEGTSIVHGPNRDARPEDGKRLALSPAPLALANQSSRHQLTDESSEVPLSRIKRCAPSGLSAPVRPAPLRRRLQTRRPAQAQAEAPAPAAQLNNAMDISDDDVYVDEEDTVGDEQGEDDDTDHRHKTDKDELKRRNRPIRGSKLMKIPCINCTKLGRECWEQMRGKTACYRCGRQKLRCDKPGDMASGKWKRTSVKLKRASSVKLSKKGATRIRKRRGTQVKMITPKPVAPLSESEDSAPMPSSKKARWAPTPDSPSGPRFTRVQKGKQKEYVPVEDSPLPESDAKKMIAQRVQMLESQLEELYDPDKRFLGGLVALEGRVKHLKDQVSGIQPYITSIGRFEAWIRNEKEQREELIGDVDYLQQSVQAFLQSSALASGSASGSGPASASEPGAGSDNEGQAEEISPQSSASESGSGSASESGEESDEAEESSASESGEESESSASDSASGATSGAALDNGGPTDEAQSALGTASDSEQQAEPLKGTHASEGHDDYGPALTDALDTTAMNVDEVKVVPTGSGASPAVNLIPPTPQTSQEAAAYATKTLIPAPNLAVEQKITPITEEQQAGVVQAQLSLLAPDCNVEASPQPKPVTATAAGHPVHDRFFEPETMIAPVEQLAEVQTAPSTILTPDCHAEAGPQPKITREQQEAVQAAASAVFTPDYHIEAGHRPESGTFIPSDDALLHPPASPHIISEVEADRTTAPVCRSPRMHPASLAPPPKSRSRSRSHTPMSPGMKRKEDLEDEGSCSKCPREE
ncbi:hypothetical protein JOM56_014242 [Amanita muscaria]